MGLSDPHPFNFVDLNKHSNLQIDSRTLLLGAVFMLLLLISTLSLVYFLYTCIRRSQSSASTLSPSPPASTGLDKATINCLPIVQYGSSLSADSTCRVGECSICLAMFQVGDKVKVLPLCYHGFHSECVDEWLRSRPSCPLCRACVVRVDSLAQSV
ncbi:RING-H2 finger protein ATL66-like [Rhododendron vialii]|uniref:RING-H2 finger protein ATL66-like n=1 Tax=Rhododendron vialii TaxID=182163 RepID=UPI00265E61E0|nr:RING-H2 finger protein ATL66-like [Rhododendron vialii]